MADDDSADDSEWVADDVAPAPAPGGSPSIPWTKVLTSALIAFLIANVLGPVTLILLQDNFRSIPSDIEETTGTSLGEDASRENNALLDEGIEAAEGDGYTCSDAGACARPWAYVVLAIVPLVVAAFAGGLIQGRRVRSPKAVRDGALAGALVVALAAVFGGLTGTFPTSAVGFASLLGGLAITARAGALGGLVMLRRRARRAPS